MFEFKGEIEGWTVNMLSKNHWRVASTMNWKETMQEAHCTFLHCRRKYGRTVKEAKHFMALYKTAWTNRMVDLAYEDTMHRALQPLPDDAVYEPAGETDNDGFLAILIEQAPADIKLVVSMFLNAPQELLESVLRGWNAGGAEGSRSGSLRVNKLLGLPLEQPTMERVREYFS